MGPLTLVDVCGYTATLLNITGNYMLTNMNRWGWVFRFVVNVLYLVYAFQIEQGGPVILNHVAFMFINVRGWLRWGRVITA